MVKPLISVVIPAYNAEGYVKEAVDSALSQTYKNCEVVVVDDGSTDGTKNILAPYVREGKIKYIYQENKGLSGARNTGIRNSAGDYIALLDADDIFFPKKIEEQVSYLMSHPDCDVSYCDLYHFWDGAPEKLMKLDYKYYSGSDVFPNLLRRSFIAPVTVVFKRKVFEKYGYFDETIRQYAEDFEFWLRLSYRGANICFLPKILAKLRLRKEGNIQSNQPKMKLTALKVLESLYGQMPPAERMLYKMDERLRAYRLKTALAYLMAGDKKSALEFVGQNKLLRLMIHVLPENILKFAVRTARYLKQRFLLKKGIKLNNG